MQGEAASANVDAAPVNPEDLAEITHEGGYTEQQVANEMEQPWVRRCQPAL